MQRSGYIGIVHCPGQKTRSAPFLNWLLITHKICFKQKKLLMFITMEIYLDGIEKPISSQLICIAYTISEFYHRKY